MSNWRACRPSRASGSPLELRSGIFPDGDPGKSPSAAFRFAPIAVRTHPARNPPPPRWVVRPLCLSAEGNPWQDPAGLLRWGPEIDSSEFVACDATAAHAREAVLLADPGHPRPVGIGIVQAKETGLPSRSPNGAGRVDIKVSHIRSNRSFPDANS